jgi:hypothetical protein
MDATVIRCLAGYGSGGNTYGMLFHNGGSVNFTCEGMTFDTDGRFGGNLGTLCFIRFVQEMRLIRVRFTDIQEPSRVLSAFDLHGGNGLYLTGCEFVQSSESFLGVSNRVLIDGCRFIGHRDANSLLSLWGGSKFSVTGCIARDYDTSSATGQCKGRFISGSGNWGITRDFYFGGNTTQDLTPRDDPSVDQNSGEQFMWEGLVTDWRGAVASAGASDAVCPALDRNPIGAVAVVVAGAGLGQSRRVTAWDAAQTRLTVDQPWQFPPDSTSVLSIGRYLSRVGVYGNTFDGKPRAPASPTHIASSGVQPYGGSQDIVVRRNTFHELRCAISNWSMSEGSDAARRWIQPNVFALFADNRIEGCRWAASQTHADWSGAPTAAECGILGTVYRKNTIVGTVETVFDTSAPDAGRIQFTLYDRNTADRGTCGAQIANARDTVLIGNAMARGAAAGDLGGAAMSGDSRPCLRDNTWTGFAAAYTGTTPGGVLEIPRRVLELTAAAGGKAATVLQVWDAGTASLAWSVGVGAPWLAIAPLAGSIADERGASAVTMTADSAGLPLGPHEAVVTVSAGAQAQRVTVRFTVKADLDEASVPLAQGYTLLALPLIPAQALTAEGLARQIDAQGGSCTSVIAYRDGAFVTHPTGTAMNNFTIEAGRGYFVRCARAGAWTARGFRFYAPSATVALEPGYTLAGLPVEPESPGAYTAERAGIEINGQGGLATQIVGYDASSGQFVAHPIGTAVNNFPLPPGMGFFVRCGAPSTWEARR